LSKQLGPTFGEETIAAGLGGLPFVWGQTDDSITGRENLDAAQNTTLDGVIAAHDPTKKPLPEIAPETEALFKHENRIRALEGAPPLTLEEAVKKIKEKKL
jgi:hypothetical protein